MERGKRIGIAVGVALAGLMFTSVAEAQDVKPWSRQDAEAAIAGEGADGPAEDCPRLPNGKCAKVAGGERAFSLQKSMGGNRGAPAAATPAAPGRRPAANAPAYAAPRRGADPAVGRMSAMRRPAEVPLQFKLGSDDLSPQSRKNLTVLASVLNAPQNRLKHVRISGHTDRSGSLAVNQRLSQQRADAVAAFLARQGVDRARIEAEGRGYDDPLPNMSAYDARNRRVEIERVQ